MAHLKNLINNSLELINVNYILEFFPDQWRQDAPGARWICSGTST